jgi:hypothetical protein
LAGRRVNDVIDPVALIRDPTNPVDRSGAQEFDSGVKFASGRVPVDAFNYLPQWRHLALTDAQSGLVLLFPPIGAQ